MEKFRDYWPLSVRAVYYRLLGKGRSGRRLPGRADGRRV
jgi:hypothetical protein